MEINFNLIVKSVHLWDTLYPRTPRHAKFPTKTGTGNTPILLARETSEAIYSRDTFHPFRELRALQNGGQNFPFQSFTAETHFAPLESSTRTRPKFSFSKFQKNPETNSLLKFLGMWLWEMENVTIFPAPAPLPGLECDNQNFIWDPERTLSI